MQKAEHKEAAKKDQESNVEAEDYSAGKYGIAKLIQSAETHSDRKFVKVSDLSQFINKGTVWVRGRVHTSRSKGKQCFLILRQQSSTVQCVIAVGDEVSKQMVKFSGR